MNNSLLKKSMTAAAVAMVVTAGAVPRFQESVSPVPNRKSSVAQTKASAGSDLIMKRKPGTPTKLAMPESLKSLDKTAFSSKKRVTRAENNQDEEVLIYEDFSLWTEGSPENPIYLGDIEGFYIGEYNFDINPDRMQDKKMWGGYATCTAGGMCALAYPGMGGMIQTPMGDYSGELHISVKVKVIDNEYTEEDDEGLFICAMCQSPWEDPQPLPPSAESPYYADMEFIPKDGEWHDYEWTYINTYGGDDCFIQFNTRSQMLISEIKVTVNNNFMPDPTPLAASSFTLDGFTANWSAVKNASEYLLTCWREVPTSDGPGEMECNFDDVNNTDGVINMDDPNFPKGWEFDFNGATPRLLTEADGFESNAFCFDADGQTITSPSTGAPITSVTMKLQLFGEEDEDGYFPGRLGFSGWDGYKWEGFGCLYFDEYFLDEMTDYDDITFALEYQGGKYYKIRLDMSELFDDAYIAVDDIKITTLTPCEKDYAVTNLPVQATSYVFTGLDPYSDYYYDVTARNPELGLDSGDPIACTYAFGVSTPVTLAASDVDPSTGEYTANWEATPKAQEYVVNTFLAYTAPEDVDNYTVLKETFEKVDYGFSVNDPMVFDNFEFISLDEFCDNPGWVGYLCALAQKAIGGVGMPFWGYGGELQTPWLSLANNDGKFSLLVSACSPEGDYLCVVNSKGEGYSAPLTDEYQDYEFEFTSGTDFDFIAFYTLGKNDFFIDYVEITQNLKKGDKVLSQRDSYNTDATSYRLKSTEALAPNCSAAYSITAVHSNDTDIAYSDFSPAAYVDFSTTAVEMANVASAVSARGENGEIKVNAPDDAKVSIVAANGVKMAAFAGSKNVKVPAGMYIVKVADNTFKLKVK